MEIPKWTGLNKAQYEQVEKAIAEAEGTTNGEIVPMIVRRSSTIGHVPMIVMLVCLMVFLVVDSYYYHWSWPVWGASAVGILVLTRLLSPLDWVQRALIADSDEVSQVNRRAELEFFERKVGKTKGATGILLFVSMMERRAVVLADEAISSKLPPETWQGVVDELIGGIKQGSIEKGFSTAIQKCGQILSREYPKSENNTNELRDHLIIAE